MSIAENLFDTLSTESLVMFGVCLGTVGILVLCILLIACYNCICNEDVESGALNLPYILESGNPLFLKENLTKTKWLTMKTIDNKNQKKSMEMRQITSHRTKHETLV